MPEPLLCVRSGEIERKKLNEVGFEREQEKLLDSIIPRSVVIVPRSKSQPTSRRVTPTSSSECYGANILEKYLPNGDLYVGNFANCNTPHGWGKYLWRDGCMYEGDWKRGKASGNGRFYWPSGATFEGEFKSGRMDGTGTFIGSDGDVYKGSWSGDRKHGYGVKRYSNGDYYEGHWKKNVQDGQGRYCWRNGNAYIGEWKNGMIHGRGVLAWSNGNRYDGIWESGFPKGNGVFTWPDGSYYIGYWSNDSNKCRTQFINGIFYPALNSTSCTGNEEDGDYFSKLYAPFLVMGTEESVNTVVLESVGAKKRSSVEGVMAGRAFPRICIWESDGEAGDITCDILDNVESSMLCKEGFVLDRDMLKQLRRNPCCFGGCEAKKPGETIFKGHKNYDLMLNLQLGIRYSVGKHASILRDLKLSDFDPREKFWTRFPPDGSKITPPHPSVEFRWKDYCPVVFRNLRELFQVDPANYMLAICGNDALRELSSPGKSGSFFYLTQDDRFMIKTVKKSEVKVLIKMLPSYHKHVRRYENSLVTKFYGVHCVKPVGGVKTRFIVMGNLFCSEHRIHRRFDLKGSSHGRTTNKPEGERDETTTLKDLDLNFLFRLQTSLYQEVIKQIDRDCKFLEAAGIMDYSLLVGLHFRDNSSGDRFGLPAFLPRRATKDSYQNEKFTRSCRFLEAELQGMDRVLSGRKPLIRLGANVPARAERVARTSDFDQNSPGGLSDPSRPSFGGEIYEIILYFGIIDILQDYDISKKLEHVYKSFHVDSTSISAVDPKLYSKRFRDFVGRIFVEDT